MLTKWPSRPRPWPGQDHGLKEYSSVHEQTLVNTELFENVDATSIIDFVDETNFYHLVQCYLFSFFYTSYHSFVFTFHSVRYIILFCYGI